MKRPNIKDCARIKGVLPKPMFNKLKAICKRVVNNQLEDYGHISFSVAAFNGILMCNQDVHVPYQHRLRVMHDVLTSLGLEDDGTRTNTYTKKGCELPELPFLRAIKG